jgi:hypothetical protein
VALLSFAKAAFVREIPSSQAQDLSRAWFWLGVLCVWRPFPDRQNAVEVLKRWRELAGSPTLGDDALGSTLTPARRGRMSKLMKHGLALALVLTTVATGLSACGARPAVSRKCRDIVAMAAVDIDAWRYIQVSCTDGEQQSLLAEFRERGLSTSEIDKSRSSAKVPR